MVRIALSASDIVGKTEKIEIIDSDTVLTLTRGNITHTADILNCDRKTLRKYIDEKRKIYRRVVRDEDGFILGLERISG